MKQYVNTYRITISDEMKEKLMKLKDFNIKPTAFIRAAIEQKLKAELPMIKVPKAREPMPF